MPEALISDWQLYLLLAKMLGSTDLKEQVATANEADCWADLLSLSSQHMVTTQLYWVLKSEPPAWQQIDADSKDYLQHIFELNHERNNQLIRETKDILTKLNQQNITPMLLKGTAALLAEDYPHRAYRMQLDIDFFVRPEDLDLASQVIINMGYRYAEEVVDNLQPVSDKRLSRLLKIYRDHKHLPPLLNPNKRVLVELHRHPYSKRFQGLYPITDLFKRAQVQNNDGLSWYQMSQPDQIELLLVEGYVDAGFRRAFQLPLRLARDYLDMRQTGNLHINALKASKINQRVQFAQELIQAILTPAQSEVSKVVKAYLYRMESLSEKPHYRKAVDLYAIFVRRAINLAHSPSLIRRLF